ncbi:MAG: DUF3108 domain-containing protein [Candidatus Omnitrophota bacterium]
MLFLAGFLRTAGAVTTASRWQRAMPLTLADSRNLNGIPEQERLVYKVKWLGITAGEITAEIKKGVVWQGRSCYVIEARVRTIGLTSKLYHVDDFFRSYLDAEKLYALRHEERRYEGTYRKDAVTDFDHVLGKAHFHNAVDRSEKTFDIPAGVQDILTAAYLGRFLPLTEKGLFRVKVCNSERVYDLYMSAGGRAVISRRHTFHLVPFVEIDGKDIREGRGSGYVTEDAGRVPLWVVIKGPVFTQVTAVLDSSRG